MKKSQKLLPLWGLEKVANTLGVQHVAGKSHQAGSDTLLTLQTYRKYKDVYFKERSKYGLRSKNGLRHNRHLVWRLMCVDRHNHIVYVTDFLLSCLVFDINTRLKLFNLYLFNDLILAQKWLSLYSAAFLLLFTCDYYGRVGSIQSIT